MTIVNMMHTEMERIFQHYEVRFNHLINCKFCMRSEVTQMRNLAIVVKVKFDSRSQMMTSFLLVVVRRALEHLRFQLR